jgi:WD40 repeat protein
MRSGLAPPPPLARDLGREMRLDAPVNGCAFVGGEPLFALGDGTVARGDGAAFRAHDGAILCASLAPDGRALLTGGDDGRLAATTSGGETRLHHDTKGKWIESIAAAGPSGAIALALGRTVQVLAAGGAVHAFALDRAANALAFDGKGRRLAVAHAEAATLLWALGPSLPRQRLEWAGAHLSVALRPQGDFIVTGMAEGALRGWRLSDQAHFRMPGYPFKPRSLSFGLKGRVLATSGAGVVLVWPFEGKDGPMGQAAVQLPVRPGLVTAVAFHPFDALLAAGYADGGVHLIRLEDGADIHVAGPPPPEESPAEPLANATAIEHLVWSADGRGLAWGGQDGAAGFVRLPH